jgi:mono/diheme cytochrome c family protein
VVIMVRTAVLGAVAGLAAAIVVPAAAMAADGAPDSQEARGRYLTIVSGCNDCHTAGYPEQGGAVPESEWLTGVAMGYQGPWGTTYPANLRLVVQSMTEAQWLKHARQERLPPMPWFNLRQMTDEDLAAIYAYIRSLGAPGVAAPAYVAPGGKVTTPYIVFVPQVDSRQAATR